MAEAKAKDAASAAANMLPEDAIEAMQVAKDHATLAEGLRAAVPEEKRAYGIKGCGAAVGDDAFVEDFLLQQERELCGDQVTGTPGTIAAVTTDLASLNAHCASAAILYSLQSRVDHLLAVHLPSLTRRLATAVDLALRKAYAVAHGADMLDPEGNFVGQRDPTFVRDRVSLKASQGGGGYRVTTERAPFLNSLINSLTQMSGTPTAKPLWESLSPIIGDRSVHAKENNPETSCWTTFFNSDSRWAKEMQEEVERLRTLRAAALEEAGLTDTPPKSAIFDAPNAGFGAGTTKVHKQVFDEIRALRVDGLVVRAKNLLPADQRRIAFETSHNDPFANSIAIGMPLRDTPFTDDEYHVAVQTRNGVALSCLAAHTQDTLHSNAAGADKHVDPFGNNIKKLVGAEGGGTTGNHNGVVDVISTWLKRAGIPHKGGAQGRPRTCKDMFTLITQALNDVTLEEDDRRVLQSIICDILADARSVPARPEDCSHKTPLAGKVIMIDVKTKACNNDYHTDSAPTETRQAAVASDYLKRAAKIDSKLGTPEGATGPMVLEFKKYGATPGKVLVPVVGAFAEMSSDVSAIADLIATALAADHVQFYNASAKQSKGMFTQRIQKAWGYTAHRGWARLLLDRRRDLIVRGPTTTCTGSMREPDDDQFELFNHYHPDRGGHVA